MLIDASSRYQVRSIERPLLAGGFYPYWSWRQNAFASTQAQLAAARANLRQAELNLDYTKVYDARTTAIALREQSLKLRGLLQNGANESLYFRRRLPSYTMAVLSLDNSRTNKAPLAFPIP